MGFADPITTRASNVRERSVSMGVSMKWARGLVLVSACLFTVAAPLCASAQSDKDDEEQKVRAKKMVEAERLKRIAMGLGRRGKFEEAFSTFAQVLPLVDYPDDQVLYNMGVIAYEGLKDCRRALLYFHGYLYAAPGDASAAQVKQRRNACLARLKDTGTLVLSGEPDGAEVRINDVILGRLPLKSLILPSGPYQIGAHATDYSNYAAEATVEVGLETRHVAALSRKIYKGNLRVVTKPAGATVFLNEVNVGTGPVLSKNLPTKKYLVRIEKAGMDRWVRYVTIERGQTVTVDAKLESTGENVPIPSLPD
ncbi:MAG: hypothetical protein ACI9OJ_000697 [Myxococcota bacterium]